MTSNKDKSISALVKGCRKGNKQDWAELIDRVAPVIFSVCYRFRLAREESFDVFGRVSLLLLEHLSGLRDEERVFGYVSTVAFREAAAIKARSKAQSQALGELALDEEISTVQAEALQAVELDQELRIMTEAFRRLSRRCQELLRMLFFETTSVSYREIARRLNIPVSSIGPTRLRCLEKLRQHMTEKGFDNL